MKIFLLLVLFFPFLCIGQKKAKSKDDGYLPWLEERGRIKFPEKNGHTFYEIIDSTNVQNISQGDLVTAFKASLSQVLKAAKLAIDVEDRDGGLLVANVTDSYDGINATNSIKMKITFNARNGRFRIQISDIEIGYPYATYNGYSFSTEYKFQGIEVFEIMASSQDNYNKLKKTENKNLSIDKKRQLVQHFYKLIELMAQRVVFNANEKF